MSGVRLKLRVGPTSSQEFDDPTAADLRRSVFLLHGNPGAVAELAYIDTCLVIRALRDHRYLVEYSDPAIGTWVAERGAYARQPPLSVFIGDRERLLRGTQLMTQADALHALEDFLDGGTRSGRGRVQGSGV